MPLDTRTLLEAFARPLLHNWPILAILVAFVVVFKILRSPTFKGWFGEAAVRRGLKRLDPAIYQSYHDLYLPRPDGKGTAQIDHTIVSPFGIFVVETKNYRGWIFGSEKDSKWTQKIYKRKEQFQNPLRQNHLHIRALEQFLGLPQDRFHSVVFFIGDTTFKTPMPENVLNGGLLRWIGSHNRPLLTPDQLTEANAKLHQIDKATDRRKASRAHVEHLMARR